MQEIGDRGRPGRRPPTREQARELAGQLTAALARHGIDQHDFGGVRIFPTYTHDGRVDFSVTNCYLTPRSARCLTNLLENAAAARCREPLRTAGRKP